MNWVSSKNKTIIISLSAPRAQPWQACFRFRSSTSWKSSSFRSYKKSLSGNPHYSIVQPFSCSSTARTFCTQYDLRPFRPQQRHIRSPRKDTIISHQIPYIPIGNTKLFVSCFEHAKYYRQTTILLIWIMLQKWGGRVLWIPGHHP